MDRTGHGQDSDKTWVDVDRRGAQMTSNDNEPAETLRKMGTYILGRVIKRHGTAGDRDQEQPTSIRQNTGKQGGDADRETDTP